MERALQWFARCLTRHSRSMTLALLGLTLVSLFGITRLTIDPANERLFLRQTPSYRVYQRFLATFGSDEVILIALHDPTHTLLTPAGIAAIRALTQALEHLPQVATVFSLTNVPDVARLTLSPFGIDAPPLVVGERLSAEQITAIAQNDLLIGTLLSRDLHTAGLLVVPHKTMTSSTARATWIAAVRAVAIQHARQGRQTYVAGTPLERVDVTSYLARDQRLIVPLVFLVLLGLTWSILRVTRLALLPLLCVLVSLSWTMGLVGFLGIALNIITSLLSPVVMVVSVSAAVHLINQFQEEIAAGWRGVEAVERTICHIGTACFLTSLTTALGFFSLLVSPVPAIRDFAFFTGVGALLSFVVALTGVPLGLLSMSSSAPERFSARQNGVIERLLTGLVRWVSGHRGRIFLGSIVLLVLCVPGMWRLTEGTDIVRSLKRHAPLRISTEFIDHHLSGVNSLEVFVQLPTAADPMTIRRVLSYGHWLRAQPGVTAVHSAWEPLRRINPQLLQDDTRLTTLVSMLPLAFPLDAWLDATGTQLRISVRVVAMRSDAFLDLAERVQQQAELVHLPVHITGSNYLLAQMSRTLVQTQIRAVGLAIVLVLGSMAVALRSWKLGLLAAIPNIVPTIALFGVMGWCDVALSTATTMIASVALGLIVDDTIHLLYRYGRERNAERPPVIAIEQALRTTGRALLSTTLILTLGFWVGVLGSFRPTITFSFLTGLTLLVALLADLLLTPAVILAWEGAGRKAAA